MAFVWMLMMGLAVGVLARCLVPARLPPSLFMSMLVGVAGSVVAGLIGRGVGFYDVPGQGAGIFASLLGATALLFVYRAVRSH